MFLIFRREQPYAQQIGSASVVSMGERLASRNRWCARTDSWVSTFANVLLTRDAESERTSVYMDEHTPRRTAGQGTFGATSANAEKQSISHS
jgi:hypothetical protein